MPISPQEFKRLKQKIIIAWLAADVPDHLYDQFYDYLDEHGTDQQREAMDRAIDKWGEVKAELTGAEAKAAAMRRNMRLVK